MIKGQENWYLITAVWIFPKNKESILNCIYDCPDLLSVQIKNFLCWISVPEEHASSNKQKLHNIGKEVGGGFKMQGTHVHLRPIHVDVR